MNVLLKLPVILIFTSLHFYPVLCQKQKYIYKCAHSSSSVQASVLQIPSHLISTNHTTSFGLQKKCSPRHQNCHAEGNCQNQTLVVFLNLLPDLEEDEASSNGFTRKGLLRFEYEYFHRNEYCIKGLNTTHIEISICKADCGKSSLCVPKCCSVDKVLDIKNERCAYNEDYDWKPLVYKNENARICGEKKTNLRFHYYHSENISDCQEFNKYTLRSVANHKEIIRVRFRLLQNGSLILKELQLRTWTLLPEGSFCLDGVQNLDEQNMNDQMDQILLVCIDPDPNKVDGYNSLKNLSSNDTSKLTVTGILYIFLLFSGTPFLLMTVVVYILLWDKQNVHGWTLFSHSLAMLFNYFGQGIANTVSRVYDSEDNASFSCRLSGVANHFFVLASFCWLTMINFDIWSTFRNLQNTIGKSKGIKRYFLYMAFAWGLPLAAVIIGVTLDSKYGLYGNDADCEVEVVVPLYGHRSCYIVEEARSYYLYYPIAALMTSNLVFAGLTVYNMYKHAQSTKTTLVDSSNRHRQSFKVLAKLFVVMGMVWMLEVVVWSLKKKDETLPWYLIFPDVLNFFQAVAIFILFACQRKVIKQLWDAYPRMRPLLIKIKRLPCFTVTQQDVQESSVVMNSFNKKGGPKTSLKLGVSN